MDKYSRLFIRASVMYLGFGVLLGLHMSFSDTVVEKIRFVHIHSMLLGFVAMMIYGVAYHILPRFNAKPVPYPSWIPIHFWLANVGLLGMLTTFYFGAYWTTGPKRMMFATFSSIEGVAIFLFIINLFLVLRDDPAPEIEVVREPEPQSAPEPTETIKVSPSMKISEIVDKWPEMEETLMMEGLGDVANPSARQTIGKIISLEKAAKKAGIDVFGLIAKLEGKNLVTLDDDGEKPSPAPPSHPEGHLAMGRQINRGELALVDTQIGNLLETYPETREVFATHYGEGCFTCPGQKTETIEQTAAMHGIPAQKILDEINAIIETVR